MTTKTKSRIQQYRSRMQKQGYRQINLWVPDTRAAAFARECKRQSRLLAADPAEKELAGLLVAAAAATEGWSA